MWGVWVLVATPAVMILVIGILILVYQRSIFDVIMGLLLVVFCMALGAGATVTLLGIQADRKLAALQVDFVSKVSHELKTPLTSIRMFVETLKMGRVTEPEKVAQCLGVIDKETQRLSVLIGRLLSWGAMESGAFKVDRRPVQVRALIDKALEAFRPQTMTAKVQLTVDVEPDLPLVNADEAAIVDALLNLLNNALKYGGKDKRIEFHAGLSEDGQVLITVRDFGIGIDLSHQSRIFDRFYRADERYARSIGGTGLGLAIARHIVVAHEGSINVESAPEKGSTFSVILPVLMELEEKHEQRAGFDR